MNELLVITNDDLVYLQLSESYRDDGVALIEQLSES